MSWLRKSRPLNYVPKGSFWPTERYRPYTLARTHKCHLAPIYIMGQTPPEPQAA